MTSKGSHREPYNFEKWCQSQLSKLLKFKVGEDLVQYLLEIETAKDTEEYIRDLLGSESKAVDGFIREFFRRWHPPQRKPSSPNDQKVALMTQLVRTKDEDMVLFATPNDTPSDRKKHQQVTYERKNPTDSPPPGFSDITNVQASTMLPISNLGNTIKSTKTGPVKSSPLKNTSSAVGPVTNRHKQKFVPLMSAEGKSRAIVQLPGRHSCQCLGQKHTLVNNCIECGRIVCSQEGSGPCVFCGALVCTPEEEEILLRDSKKGQKFREKFLKQFQIREDRALDHIQRSSDLSGGLNSAVQHKDKLLEFDQTSVSRTKVIDDEMDYYAVDSNRWLSTHERDLLRTKEDSLREKRHESRRNKAVTLDFAGRKVVDGDGGVDTYEERHALEALEGYRSDENVENAAVIQTHAGGLYNPSIPIAPPKYQETHKERRRAKKQLSIKSDTDGRVERTSIVRLQDSALQEMTDEGKCMSMHQPWASLLVAGIKICEGRTWYSTHRGRLWIAATVKKPEIEEIERLEQFYRNLHRGKGELAFPEDYPTSCLLGCVDMVDCLPQEEYSEQFPGGESESPYVFVVDSPQQLTVKFPVKGQHKIWKLDQATHTGAKQGLKPASPYCAHHYDLLS